MAVDSILYSHLGNRSYLLEALTFSPGQDKRYTRNKQLWRDVISEKLRAYTTVTLEDFLVFEWFPRSPGLFYTRGAKNARAEALGNIDPHFTLRPHMENVDNDPVSGVKNLNSGNHRVVFTPLGKSSMLQGGVGCIRLKPIQKDQTVLWLMSASSSYIAHEGFPLAVPNMLYQEIIAEILDTGAIRRTIVGELKFVPNPFSQLYEYYPDVPSMYLEVSEIRPARMASRNNDQQPEVSVAVSFVSNFEHRADVYASYVSFEPGVKQSFEEAVYWLKSVYIENLYKGRIITDFDQTKTHFPEAALSLRKVMGRHLGRGELEEAIGLLQVRGDVNRIYENLEIGELAHAAARVARTKVFISYSHKDTQWLERLQTHLKPLVREHSIDIWDDTEIQPGQRWEAEIDSALESAKVALLLVTANFLASDFISKTELPRLLSASERGEVVILPVIVSASQFLDMPGLREIQTVNNPGEPVDTLQRGDQERIFARVSQAIRRLLELG